MRLLCIGTIKAYLRLHLTEFEENETIGSTRGFLDSGSPTKIDI